MARISSGSLTLLPSQHLSQRISSFPPRVGRRTNRMPPQKGQTTPLPRQMWQRWIEQGPRLDGSQCWKPSLTVAQSCMAWRPSGDPTPRQPGQMACSPCGSVRRARKLKAFTDKALNFFAVVFGVSAGLVISLSLANCFISSPSFLHLTLRLILRTLHEQ